MRNNNNTSIDWGRFIYYVQVIRKWWRAILPAAFARLLDKNSRSGTGDVDARLSRRPFSPKTFSGVATIDDN